MGMEEIFSSTEENLKSSDVKIRLRAKLAKITKEHKCNTEFLLGVESVLDDILIKSENISRATQKLQFNSLAVNQEELDNDKLFEKTVRAIFERCNISAKSFTDDWMNEKCRFSPSFTAIINRNYKRELLPDEEDGNTEFSNGDYVVIRSTFEPFAFTIDNIDGGFELDSETDFDYYHPQDMEELTKEDFTLIGWLRNFRDYTLSSDLVLSEGTIKKGTNIQVAIPYPLYYNIDTYKKEDVDFLKNKYYTFWAFNKPYIKVVGNNTVFKELNIKGEENSDVGLRQLFDAIDIKSLKVDANGWLLNERK